MTETSGERLLTEDLSAQLKRARGGDDLAAREVIPSLAHILSTNNKYPPGHPKGGETIPVPDCVRDYLSLALSRIANQIDANEALWLKTEHRPIKNDHFHLRRAAYLMHQLLNPAAGSLDQDGNQMQAIKTRGEAAKLAAAAFNKAEKSRAAKYPDHKPLTVSKTAVADWYRYNESELLAVVGMSKHRIR